VSIELTAAPNCAAPMQNAAALFTSGAPEMKGGAALRSPLRFAAPP
jgi:hypothetical protein